MRRLLSLSEFVAPLPLAAVGLMAINDQWLKPRFHNALTGKLSDFAICFFLPLYLSALLGLLTRWSLRTRLRSGAWATAVVFSALKLFPAAVHLYRAAMGWAGHLLGMSGSATAVADPGDLVALPLVLVAVAWAQTRSNAVLTPQGATP